MHLLLRQFDKCDLQFWEIPLPQKHSYFLHSSFHNTVYCAWLFPSKRLPLNSRKASIHHFICPCKLLFLSPLLFFFFWKNVFKANGFTHAYYRECIRNPVLMQAGSHLTEMYFFITQTWKFHRNDHNNRILLKCPILTERRKNSHQTNSLVALMITFNDNF